MNKYITIFLQQNVARRFAPTANINKCIDALAPFSYLCRDRDYLYSVRETFTCPELFDYVCELVDSEGKLPRLLPIAMIQEPMLSGGKPTGFDSKTVVYGSESPRAIIVTLNSANISLLDQLSNRDRCCALLFTRRDKLCLTSFYHDINTLNLPIETDNILQITQNLILSGDTNAHSTLWGSPATNVRGEKWEELIMLENLFLANNSQYYTFSNHIGETHIDITLASRDNLVQKWTNTRAMSGSDHSVLLFTNGHAEPV